MVRSQDQRIGGLSVAQPIEGTWTAQPECSKVPQMWHLSPEVLDSRYPQRNAHLPTACAWRTDKQFAPKRIGRMYAPKNLESYLSQMFVLFWLIVILIKCLFVIQVDHVLFDYNYHGLINYPIKQITEVINSHYYAIKRIIFWSFTNPLPLH